MTSQLAIPGVGGAGDLAIAARPAALPGGADDVRDDSARWPPQHYGSAA
jgi:hypothetical protein